MMHISELIGLPLGHDEVTIGDFSIRRDSSLQPFKNRLFVSGEFTCADGVFVIELPCDTEMSAAKTFVDDIRERSNVDESILSAVEHTLREYLRESNEFLEVRKYLMTGLYREGYDPRRIWWKPRTWFRRSWSTDWQEFKQTIKHYALGR